MSNLGEAGKHLREAVRRVSRAAVEVRTNQVRRRSSVGGEIKVFEGDGRLVVAPVTKQKEFMREELGDRTTAPRGIWRKSLRHGSE